jgi:hypothetical protein
MKAFGGAIMRKHPLAGLLLGMVLAGAAIPSAAAQNTPLVGGSGGTAFGPRACPEGYVLVGLYVLYGAWIDKVGGLCRRINVADGSWGNEESNTGGNGGDNFGSKIMTQKCPSGSALKGFRARYGSFVHRIHMICQKLRSGGRTTGEITLEPWVGSVANSGPQEGGPHNCGDAKPAMGFRGRAGTYVDAFGLSCGYIMPGTPTLLAPASGASVLTKRPLLDWDPAPRITMPYRICLNLSSGADCSISGTIRAETSDTKWTPTSDLPFSRGDMVYWRVDACNENGCRSATRSFRFMP